MNERRRTRSIPGGASTSDRPGFGRREFLRGCAGLSSVLLLGLTRCSGDGQGSGESEAQLPVVWIEAGTCSGCVLSLLGCLHPPVEALLPRIQLEFHEALMGEYGGAAMDRLDVVQREYRGQYVLIVDGGIPAAEQAQSTVVGTDSSGNQVTAEALVQALAVDARLLVAMGTCASFGGVAAAAPNPTGSRPLAEVVGDDTPLVRIPGCPPHAEWIASTLEPAIRGERLALDELGRPEHCFGHTVHSHCPRLEHFVRGRFAEHLGDPSLCLKNVGCKGPIAKGDCPTRLWNGRSSCVRVNHPCLACTAPGFPDAREEYGEEGLPTMPSYEPLET